MDRSSPTRHIVHTRRDSVLQAIKWYNKALTDDIRKEKYAKMAVSPFSFYRATNHLFWEDFSGDWRMHRFSSPHTRIWLQGDAHAENMGAFDNHKGGIIYGMNDFDESIFADYQYDLWRFAISLVLVARNNKKFSDKDEREVLDAFSNMYLDTMRSYTGKKALKKPFYTKKNTKGLLRDFLKSVERKETRIKMLDKWTAVTGDSRIFDLDFEKLGKASQRIKNTIIKAIPNYVNTLEGDLELQPGFMKVRDIAIRLQAGTGSLGTPRYYVLIDGDSIDQDNDRILDVKKQYRPTGYWYLGAQEKREWSRIFQNPARAHAVAYRSLGKHPDDLLGWMKIGDGFYSVRERSPQKETFDTSSIKKQKDFVVMAEQWAAIMATYHARADKNYPGDLDYSIEKTLTKLIKKDRKDFNKLIRDVAIGYARQVEQDYKYFLDEFEPVELPDKKK